MKSLLKNTIPAVAIFLVTMLGTFTTSIAGTTSQIILADGSIIQAEVISYSNGKYTLKSAALGTFSLSEEQIQSIQPAGGNTGRLQNEHLQQQVQSLQEQIQSDPKAMEAIQKLQRDPAVQKILEDKELMKAIEQGDLSRVGQDPKIRSLMNNQDMEEIINRHGR